MRNRFRNLTAVIFVITTVMIMSLPSMAHDVKQGKIPNCESKARAAERLTGDRSNKQYLTRITERGVKPVVFYFNSPTEVDFKVRRDYVITSYGSVFTQRREATLSSFYVHCYDRMNLPYTYWPGQQCFGAQAVSSKEAVEWLSSTLGGRSKSWEPSRFYLDAFDYAGPDVLFTVPLDSLVRLRERGQETVLTPGYQVSGGNFTLECYAHQILA